jgi:hypothetical protein
MPGEADSKLALDGLDSPGPATCTQVVLILARDVDLPLASTAVTDNNHRHLRQSATFSP